MRSVVLRPRRRLRHEILSLVPLGVLIAALVAVFPFKTVVGERGGKSGRRVSSPSCVYVELTEEQESRAMDVIRGVFSTDKGGIRDLRADLSLSTIPERPARVVFDIRGSVRPREMTRPDLEILSLPSTLEAPGPETIPAAEPPPPDPAFPREDLLKPID